MRFPWKQKTDLLIIVTGIMTLIGYGMGIKQPEMLCTHDKIAEPNPYKVSLSSQHKGMNKRQAATSAEYSSIRIHPVFVNVASSVQSYIQSSNGPLFNSIRTLADVLMVRPVQGNLVIPPMCSEYTSGLNEGKCQAPLPSQDNYRCGQFGVIPTDYIGTREVCTTSSQVECIEDGPDGVGIPDADYLLFVSATTTSSCYGGTLAYASTCMLDVSGNDRPVAGYINICPSALASYRENILYGIFMHEIIHALGFSRSLFSRYVNENGTKYNPVRTQYGPYGRENVFTGPKTAELAKKYYACDDNNGLLLENEGGSGTVSSHWEKRTLHHELMNGYVSADYLVLSPFTIALFEDSGWYKGNYTALEMLNQFPLQWGKGLGCSFLNQRCTNKTIYPYLCDESIEEYTCTYDHLSKGRCSSNWNGFDYCPVALATDNEDHCQNDINITLSEIERYGSSSICVDATRAQFTSCGTYISSPMPLCVPQVTYSENNSSQFILQLQNETYSCMDNHSLIINNDWIVSCPSTAAITSRSTPISTGIPTPSPSTFIELNNSLYELAESYINATDIVVFGELNFLSYHQTLVYYVNSLVNNTVSVCHLFGSANSDPVEVTKHRLQGGNIYSVRRDGLVASLGFYNTRTLSQDFSLVIMLDPQANHSFVHYAACIDFVGDYLLSVHSNDESFFAITVLANDTVIRIAPSKTVTIGDTNVSYSQEHTMILNLGDTVVVSSSEDLTGSRVTANKAVSFYSGHHCTSNRDTNCSILTEQIPPYNSWGNSFMLHTNASGIRGNMFKIIASDVGANVTMNCTTDGSNYEANNFNLVFRQHKVISVIHDYCIVDSDEAILIIQFKDSDESLQDTFMTVIPALSHFQTQYVFETCSNFDNHVVMTVKNTNPNTDSLLLNNNPVTLEWELVEINEITYYYSMLSLSANNRQKLEFSRNDIKFGAMIYGITQRENNDTFALPAGLALNIREDLPFQAPSLVQDALVTVVDEMVNVTWSPPAIPNGEIHQYIVQRINSSGTFYYHVSPKQNYILLPLFNDALVFVSAVNLFGQSEFTQAKPNVPCFPSPCINNGTCVAVNATNQQLPCNCIGIYSGAFCENGDKLYPFGHLHGDESFTPRTFGGGNSRVTLNESFFFYDLITRTIYVNEDGIISIGSYLWARDPIPRNLTTLTSQYIIAPYWARAHIRAAGNVYYRQTSEPSLLARATREVQSAFPTSSNAKIKNLLIATWDSVGYYYMHSDKVNTFQCVLATNEFESFTMFFYDDGGIQWTTADSSGGVNGLGGDEAVAGISAGDGVNVITIPGSLTPSIIDIDNTSNVGIPGVWMFKVGAVNASIVLNESPGMFVDGSNSSFHLVGSKLNMSCSITSTPVANSEFRWKCSTGCLGGVETGQTITVTAQQSGVIVCAYTIDGIEYDSDPIQIHVTDFIPSILLEPAVHTVGQQQAVVCSANIIPGEDVNNSVVFTWMAPDGVNINDERLTIMPTIINGSNHTSILQFDYLMESDVGTYKCDITSSQYTFTLLVNLRDLYIPLLTARIIAPAIQNFGQPLTLTCEVTTVRGITSDVIITWRISGNELRRVENASGTIVDSSVVYRDQLYISELMSEDYYICTVIINSTSRLYRSAYYRVKLTSPNAAPSNFRNISKTSTTITFQWDALELTQSNNEITLYVITCSDLEKGSIFTTNVTGSTTMGTVYDLHPFTYYNCSVYAVTKYGGPSGNAVTVQTAEAVSSAPIITSVTAIDSYSLHVMWTVPTEPNGIITNYTITYNIEALNITVNIPFNGETTQSFNITGLSPYQLVAVTITATNGAGRSTPSNQVLGRTRELDFTPSISLEPAIHTVGRQQAIACTAIVIPGEFDVNNSLVFTWMAPDGVNINDERLTIMPTVINGSNHTSILQFDYLMESDVGIYKCDITSNKSSIQQTVELEDLLIPNPGINLTAPAIQNFREPLTLTCEVTVVRGITSDVIITWISLGNELRRVENASGSIVGNSVVYRDQLYISELTSEDNYTCRAVIKSTSQSQNEAFITIELTSPNAAPRNLRTINKTSTTVIFQWDALVLAQSNNNITWYVITCSSLEDNTTITRNITGDNTVGAVTGLRPFTSYECTIHAVTKYGGPHSSYITVKTLEGVPSAPVITAVTAIDSQSVLVTWRIPAEPNGVITGYTITYNTEGFLNFTVNVTFNGKPTQSFNITGLSTYQLVVVTITAINGAGRSSPSNQVSNRTMELAPGIVEFHVNDLAASSEVKVTWSPPLQPNGIITSYQVIYSVYESSTVTTSEMLNNTTNSYTIRNLVPGIPYQVTVVALTIAGRGALNDYIVFFSEELMPERFPSNISYTRLNETIINVTWTPMSLSEAQGFPLYQVILSEPSTNSGTTIDIVVTNGSFVIFANLSIDQEYSLIVGVSTGSNRSAFVYSDPIIVSRLTGGHSGAAVIGGTIGRIVLIAILIVIIF